MNFWPIVEKNLVPDTIIRAGIRKQLKDRLNQETRENSEEQQEHFNRILEVLKSSPIAVNTVDANEQHYELPTDFFKFCLGKNLKYSSAYFHEGITSLDQAEDEMLHLTCLRAELVNGQDVLELGCGWGSLSLFMASHFSESTFTVVSNSRSQKIYIDEEAKKRNLSNLTVITADMNQFEIDKKFDRVVSVEMFEHMRNYTLLFRKVANFLKEDGKCFVHIFTHRDYTYLFEVKDKNDWMSKYFFSGGIMPSKNLFFYFNEDLKIDRHWVVNGKHYEKTANSWLQNMDEHKGEILPLMDSTYGRKEALKWWVYWRIFYMSCAELWGYKNGNEWMVCHYLFSKNK